MEIIDLVNRERELEKRRTVALARQQWATVIEVEAKLEELNLWRQKMLKDTVEKITTDEQ